MLTLLIEQMRENKYVIKVILLIGKPIIINTFALQC